MGFVRFAVTVVCCLTLLVVTAQPQRLLKHEDFIETCRKVKRDELESCLMNLINSAGSNLEAGIPEFGIPPGTQVTIDYMSFSDYRDENSYLSAEFYNTLFKGLDELKITKLKIDYDNKLVDWEASIPLLHVTGRYKLDAQLFLVPLKGEGTYWAKLDNAVIGGRTQLGMRKEGNDYFLTAPHTQLSLDFEDASAKFNSLYDDNPVLKQAAEAFINGNSRELMQEILPAINDQLAEIANDRATYFASKIPLRILTGEEYLRKSFNIYD